MITQSWNQIQEVLKPIDYGLHKVEFDSLELPDFQIDNILGSGDIEIFLDELEQDSLKRAIYLDRQVLIYIKDQGQQIIDVKYGKLEQGKMIHLKRCSTIGAVTEDNRGDRFRVIIRGDGYFPVNSDTYGYSNFEFLARRRVCLNCLSELGLVDRLLPSSKKKQLASNFDYELFLDGSLDRSKLFNAKYSEEPPELTNKPSTLRKQVIFPPVKVIGENTEGKPTPEVIAESWPEFSKKVRESKAWTCEGCGSKLENDRSLLHVHHANGEKNDNRLGNLKVLCIVCHSEQPMHSHIKASEEQRAKIQSLIPVDSYELLDPSIEDLVENWCLEKSSLNFTFGDELIDSNGEVLIDAMALCREQNIAIVFSAAHYHEKTVKQMGWKVINLEEYSDDESAIYQLDQEFSQGRLK